MKNGDISRVIGMRDVHVVTRLGYKLILKKTCFKLEGKSVVFEQVG